MKIIKTRLKPEQALCLGLKLTKSGQYRITTEQRESLDSSKFLDYCKDNNIDKDSVGLYWDKSKDFSILVKPDSINALTLDEVIDNINKKITDHSPKYKPFSPIKPKTNNLLVIDIADCHFGKLCSAYETGESYNVNIAKKRCIDGVNGILNKSICFGIDKIMFVIGNDVLHYDNAKQTTTAGTFQNSDVMFYDMFNIALETYVEIIESLITDYHVDIVFNASNHDYVSGWMFARTLSSWFRNASNVTVCDSIKHRKYYQYGVNMIGTNHGDGAKMDNLPLLMANEEPLMWAVTSKRYIYLHHIHHKQTYKFKSGMDYIGVTVEYLRSPSGTDSWHHRNGYCGNKKAIEGFIHNFHDGQIARITHYF